MSNQIQIERIIEKLNLVRKKDSNYNEFGANYHKYILNKPAKQKEIEDFQKALEIELPEGYKNFISKIGNGGLKYKNHTNSGSGAGPNYGIYKLGNGLNEISAYASTTLKNDVFFNPEITEDEWSKVYDEMDENISDEEYYKKFAEVLSGIMIIGHCGCSGYQGLILNGQHKGKVIYVYLEIEYRPHISQEGYFLDWYEAWLDRVIEKEIANVNTNHSFWHKIKTVLNLKS